MVYMSSRVTEVAYGTHLGIGHKYNTAVSPCSAHMRETDASVPGGPLYDGPPRLQPSTLFVTPINQQQKESE